MNTCPNSWKEENTRQKCQGEDEADNVLSSLPVFDKDSHLTYKNIFCARCNGAVNTSYWQVSFDCRHWFDLSNFNLSYDLRRLHNRCRVDKIPGDSQLNYLKRCIPRLQVCNSTTPSRNYTDWRAECVSYSLPVFNFGKGFYTYRNPHCALCNGVELSYLNSVDKSRSTWFPPVLTVLFDFSSTSKFCVKAVKNFVHRVVGRFQETKSCSNEEVYDPYLDICKKIISKPEHINIQNVSKKWNPNCSIPEHSIQNGSKLLNPNCTVIAYNKTDYEQLPNGTVFLKAHGMLYSNISYTIHDNRLFLCVHFSQNYTLTKNESGGVNETKTTPKSLRLLTLIGSVVSMVCLVLLLVTYILFAELRNLPGKIIINLTISLLLYQSVFFSMAKNGDRKTCLAVAVLLHFFVLSSFTWMNVMAYELHRTFTNVSGKVGMP